MSLKTNKKPAPKFKKPKGQKLDIKYHGHVALCYPYKGKYTRDDIQKYANKLSKELKQQKFKGSIGVSLHTVDGYKAAMFREVGNPVRLYTVEDSDRVDATEDQEYYSGFSVILFNGLPRYGGKDKYNDCLYNALKLAMVDDIPWKSACAMKRFLKVERNAKISIDDIPKIDQKLKQYKINVSGDHMYTSPKDCKRTIKLTLIDEHYELDQSNKGYSLNVNFKEKKPVICFLGSSEVETYDGVEKKTITIKDFYKMRKCNKHPYIYVPINRSKQRVCDRKTIEEEYKLFIERADELKEKTNGKINLYKTGDNKTTAINLFDRFNKALSPEDIQQDEAFWIECSTTGALIRANKYNGPAFKYDVVSMYPSLLKDSRFIFPIKRGEFKILDEFPDIVQTGIYRAEIEYNKEKEEMFRYNKLNYYTHFDIRFAQSIGLEATLIQDGTPNALIYSRDKCINSNQVFGEYVDFLFKLKKEGMKSAKPILNIIWGALCEYKTKNKTTKPGEILEITGDSYIRSLIPLDDERVLLKLYESKRVYATNYARLGPFLLARGRMMIGQIIAPYINDVIRTHTDGFLVKKEIKSKLIGEDIGQLKYEGYSENCVVKNCVHYDFD